LLKLEEEDSFWYMAARGLGQTIVDDEAGYSKFRALCRTRFKINIDIQRGLEIGEEDDNGRIEKTQALD
jgi:hypothetical protein